jgi:hypothetical protein
MLAYNDNNLNFTRYASTQPRWCARHHLMLMHALSLSHCRNGIDCAVSCTVFYPKVLRVFDYTSTVLGTSISATTA